MEIQKSLNIKKKKQKTNLQQENRAERITLPDFGLY